MRFILVFFALFLSQQAWCGVQKAELTVMLFGLQCEHVSQQADKCGETKLIGQKNISIDLSLGNQNNGVEMWGGEWSENVNFQDQPVDVEVDVIKFVRDENKNAFVIMHRAKFQNGKQGTQPMVTTALADLANLNAIGQTSSDLESGKETLNLMFMIAPKDTNLSDPASPHFYKNFIPSTFLQKTLLQKDLP